MRPHELRGEKIMMTRYNNVVNENLGNRLKALRVAHRLTQQDVADKMGIPKSTYGNYERGERGVPLSQLNNLCSIYNVKMDDFVKEDRIVIENSINRNCDFFIKEFNDVEFTKKQQERLIEYAKFILSKRND